MWGWLKRVAVILALILGGVWAFAPKEPVYPDIAFDPGMLPEDLVTHFQISEA
ncbi:MAG: hypothetical protein GTO62_20265, partial [Planctomycetales bacterium]|nr:hypothetical protein [Planctomycetales bacterium]NIP71504.1 hypothetical protein [Planctomycetales bacterium]